MTIFLMTQTWYSSCSKVRDTAVWAGLRGAEVVCSLPGMGWVELGAECGACNAAKCVWGASSKLDHSNSNTNFLLISTNSASSRHQFLE